MMLAGREFFILVVTIVLFHHAGTSSRHHHHHHHHHQHHHHTSSSSSSTSSYSFSSSSSSSHSRRDLRKKTYLTPAQQNNTEVLAQVGGTATIRCYTHFLSDDTVTWLKKDQDHLLTAGGQVYSSESRYSVAHVRHQKLWELSVRDVRLTDAGLYECQITSHPPTSLYFVLNVVEAHAVIHGGPEVHVHTGERLRLQCSVAQATQPPDYIFWFHNASMINYAPRRPLKVVKHHFSSSLIVSNVTWDDAGTYACEPHRATGVNITLHVVAGEKHAALHNSGKGETSESVEEPPIDGAGGASRTSSGTSPHGRSLSLLLLPVTFLTLFVSCWITTVSWTNFEVIRLLQKMEHSGHQKTKRNQDTSERVRILLRTNRKIICRLSPEQKSHQ